jgi:hypothetical protein
VCSAPHRCLLASRESAFWDESFRCSSRGNPPETRSGDTPTLGYFPMAHAPEASAGTRGAAKLAGSSRMASPSDAGWFASPAGHSIVDGRHGPGYDLALLLSPSARERLQRRGNGSGDLLEPREAHQRKCLSVNCRLDYSFSCRRSGPGQRWGATLEGIGGRRRRDGPVRSRLPRRDGSPGKPHFPRAFGGKAFAHGSAYYIDGHAGAARWLPPGVHHDEEALTSLNLRTAAGQMQKGCFGQGRNGGGYAEPARGGR